MALLSERYFSAEPNQRQLAHTLYNTVAELPLICPHGHVDPRLFADPDYSFRSPAELLIIPDHYILRMLYSQGIALADLGIAPGGGAEDSGGTADDCDHRQVWQLFADNYHLFRGTPSGLWLQDEFANVFGIDEKLSTANAQAIYDHIDAQLKLPAFQPRHLYDQFNIEVLCTTDAATDTLAHHQTIRDSDWDGRILPTFRPDALLDFANPNWLAEIALLSDVSGVGVVDYRTFIVALEQRRAFFKEMGAVAADHGVTVLGSAEISPQQADTLFQRALSGTASQADAQTFRSHMLTQMARMSVEDGLVMQIHPGSYRNHNDPLFDQFGPNMGADIPIRGEFTYALHPLLNKFGNDPRLKLILFTVDETTYGRELAPLAGHYPAVKLGPPWWFYDSLNGMRRYFDQVMETAGIYNTAGFNDDTRAFPSIPARHDLWRRASADWVAELMLRGIIDEDDGLQMVRALSYDLAKTAYAL